MKNELKKFLLEQEKCFNFIYINQIFHRMMLDIFIIYFSFFLFIFYVFIYSFISLFIHLLNLVEFVSGSLSTALTV